mmetsp:Transcript_20382/g.20089  ORF Transcript_20382/g.20089 Transcript_20382/m.20089 type:complete len:121 (-) Transcript_20382:200-562(-)
MLNMKSQKVALSGASPNSYIEQSDFKESIFFIEDEDNRETNGCPKIDTRDMEIKGECTTMATSFIHDLDTIHEEESQLENGSDSGSLGFSTFGNEREIENSNVYSQSKTRDHTKRLMNQF